jgi:hypothetical protein
MVVTGTSRAMTQTVSATLPTMPRQATAHQFSPKTALWHRRQLLEISLIAQSFDGHQGGSAVQTRSFGRRSIGVKFDRLARIPL